MKQVKARYFQANILGVIALLFWLVEPFIIENIKNVPLFLLLSISFLTSGVLSAIHITRLKQWRNIFRQPVLLFMSGLIGVWGSDFCYIYGARLAPIAYVEFIDYLWPPLFIVFACLASQHKFCKKEILGHVTSLLGLLFLLDLDLGILKTININYPGYLLGLLGAMLWAGFLTYSKSKPDAPSGMVGLFGGIGGLISIAMHLQFETFVMPSTNDLLLGILLGLTGFGLAYQFWDYGVKHGNIALLSQANYLSRLLGICALFIFTDMPITSNFWLGGGLIITTFVVSYWKYIHNFLEQALQTTKIIPILKLDN